MEKKIENMEGRRQTEIELAEDVYGKTRNLLHIHMENCDLMHKETVGLEETV